MERSIVLYTITSMCCKLPSLVVPTCKMLNLDDDVDDGCDGDDCCGDHQSQVLSDPHVHNVQPGLLPLPDGRSPPHCAPRLPPGLIILITLMIMMVMMMMRMISLP